MTTARVRLTRVPGGDAEDVVAVEEPLEIRIGGVPVAVTMRTPGHGEELALGFSIAEGLSPVAARVPDDFPANTIEVEAPGADVGRLQRNFYTSSSCGVCGKGALKAVAVEAARVESDLRVAAALVAQLPERLRAAQPTFEATGGLHATGLFTAAGELLCVREDVGRHNALDKVVGRAFLDGLLPLAGSILCVKRQALVRARPEGRRRGVPAPGRRRGAVVARDRAGRGPRDHALRLRPRRLRQRLHGAVADRAPTGVLLLGGASSRFGSPKALARFRGETLAERAWRTLGEACVERIAVGKGDLDLPFDVLVEPAEPQAPIAGVIAGLRAASNESSVFLPVDCPLVTAGLLRELREQGAVPRTGPLPGAYSRANLPELERRLAAGAYSLRGVNPRVVMVDERLLADANTPAELSALEEHLAALDEQQA